MSDLLVLFSAVLILGVICIGLILLVAYVIRKQPTSPNNTVLSNQTPTQEGNTDIAHVLKVIEDNHTLDAKAAKAYRIERITFTLFSFGVASAALAVSAWVGLHNVLATLVAGIIAVAFVLFGYSAQRHLRIHYRDVLGKGLWGD